MDPLLKEPGDAVRLSNGHTLIVDQNHTRAIEVTGPGAKVWQYGQLCTPGSGVNRLRQPFGVEAVPGGDVMITDPQGCRVIQVTPNYGSGSGGTIVWQYGTTDVCGPPPAG